MRFLSFISIVFFHFALFSQGLNSEKSRKGDFYFYWGWNLSGYTQSTISFSGKNYDFSLEKVCARNRPSPLDAKTYLSPTKFTIPQYNFRLGYFLNEKYNISFGIDHMKYVMVSYQDSRIDGYINNKDPEYNGIYENEDFMITPQFLQFEHTDGLNYLNIELRRLDPVCGNNSFSFNLVSGIGTGLIVPRTNVTLMNFERYDEFNVAGFGIAAIGGLHFEMFDRFFIQMEAKVGYINLPNVRTTADKRDSAKQDFCFLQANVVFGMKFFGK
jgi:hypothetical protein